MNKLFSFFGRGRGGGVSFSFLNYFALFFVGRESSKQKKMFVKITHFFMILAADGSTNTNLVLANHTLYQLSYIPTQNNN